MEPLKVGAIIIMFIMVANSTPIAQSEEEDNEEHSDNEDDFVPIACNAFDNIIQLDRREIVSYGWTPSQAQMEGRDYDNWRLDSYPAGTECTVKFNVPAGETFMIYMEMLNTKGSPKQGCQGGDYVQVTIDGNTKSHKACGKVDDLEDDWEWDWATEAYRIPADTFKNRTIEAKFFSPDGGAGGYMFDEDQPAEGFLIVFDILPPFPDLPLFD